MLNAQQRTRAPCLPRAIHHRHRTPCFAIKHKPWHLHRVKARPIHSIRSKDLRWSRDRSFVLFAPLRFRYAQIHEEKLRALKEQFVWIDTLPTSAAIEQQKPLGDDDFVAIYNKRMAAIKEKFRDQLGNNFASSSTPIDPQVYAQHLTQMRQQCGLVATPITTGQVRMRCFFFSS